MSVQVTIDSYFKKKSSSSPKVVKVMKRRNLSLIKTTTPLKCTRVDNDLFIVEKEVSTIDLCTPSDDEAATTIPDSSQQDGSVINISQSSDISCSSTSTILYSLSPKSPVKTPNLENRSHKKTSNMEQLESKEIEIGSQSTPPTSRIQLTNKKSRIFSNKTYEERFSDDYLAIDAIIESNTSNDISNTPNDFCSGDKNTPTTSRFQLSNKEVTANEKTSYKERFSNECIAFDATNISIIPIHRITTSPRTPSKATINNVKSSSSGKKYYSPNKKRAVVQRSPTKRSLADAFGLKDSADDEVFIKACEGMDDKTKFLLSIINKCLKDSAQKNLLDTLSQDILNQILIAKKPGARLVCRLYWRLPQWYREDQLKAISEDKKNKIDDPTFRIMLNDLVENKLITASNSGNIPMTFEDYAKMLKGDEVKQICKDLKIKIMSKKDAVESLRSFSRRSSISTYFTGTPVSNEGRVLDIMKSKAGTCYKLTDATRLALYKLYVLMYLGMNYETIRTKRLELMLINEKNNIETYPVDKEMVVDNASIVFNSKDEFDKYLDAQMLYERFIEEEDTRAKCNIVDQVFKLYTDISNKDMTRYKSLPIWLHRFTPAYLFIKILESGIQELKKDKQNELALDVVTALISQIAFRQHKKALWYAEKALILHKLFSLHDEAAKVLTEGLKSNLSFEAKDTMRKRADLLTNQKNIDLDECLKNELKEYASKELIMENKFKADHISKQHMESDKQRGKKKFKVKSNEEVKYLDAEEYCVIHYTSEERWSHASHWEGRIITTIFFLLFWDIIYTKPRGIAGIFMSHYQVFPLDMFCESFYTNRKTLIDERLAVIEKMETSELVEEMRRVWDERPEYELSGINRSFGWDNVRMVGACLGGVAAAALCRRLAHNYGYSHSGFPDLTLWNVNTGAIKFVEVKTDTDKPSVKQLRWMQYLTDHGIDTGFCYLGANTMRCRARTKDS